MIFLKFQSNGKARRIKGNFLVLAHNTSHDYWMLAEMQYRIHSVQEKINDSVIYKPYGQYSIVINNKDYIVTKTRDGFFINYGYIKFHTYFDSFGSRLRAYGKTSNEIIGKNNKIKYCIGTLEGENVVKIYKKKKKNK